MTARGKELKSLDAPVEVLIFDPVSIPLARLAARVVDALWVTFATFVVRIVAGGMVAAAHLYVGGALMAASYVLDAMDGKMARRQGRHPNLHGLLDFELDQLAYGAYATCFVWYEVHHGHDAAAVALVAFLALYLCLLATGGSRFRIFGELGLDWKKPGAGQTTIDANAHGSLLWRLLTPLHRLQDKLLRVRVLPRPTSIEATLVAFVVAPFVGGGVTVFVVACALLLPDLLATFLAVFLLARVQDAREGGSKR